LAGARPSDGFCGARLDGFVAQPISTNAIVSKIKLAALVVLIGEASVDIYYKPFHRHSHESGNPLGLRYCKFNMDSRLRGNDKLEEFFLS
jgi:hypothetical protein